MIAWKKWTKVVLIALAVATTSQVAQAKKLGGGGSFGFQKSSP
jgi:hypothetical protein